MGKKEVPTRHIKSEITDYFDREVSRVKVPPVPVQREELSSRGNGELPTGSSSVPSRTALSLFRAAALAVIIGCFAALHLVPVQQNELVEIVSATVEREALNEIVISSLQKAGQFLYENL